MKKLTILLIIPIFLLSGCATVNFSSKYYTLPTDYKKDIDEVWNEIILKVPLKYKNYYSYRIVKDNQTSLAGIPQIKQEGNNVVVMLPEYFIKYVWEFYYPICHKYVIDCVFIHELGHPESGYSDKPPEQHFLCDKYTIEKLMLPNYTSNTYYSTLIVIKDYWSARKGVGGHLFNWGWNILNLYSIAMGGFGSVGDLYATDLNYRISAIKSTYPYTTFCFKRNKQLSKSN